MAKILKMRLPKKFPTILEDCVKSGDMSAAQAVFKTCDVNASCGVGYSYSEGTTALMMRECSPAFGQWLIDNGADINATTDYFCRSALQEHIYHSSGFYNKSLIKPETFIAWGININHADKDSHTALHAAARTSNIEAVVTLLSAGATVDALAPNQCPPYDIELTPLEYAFQRYKSSLVMMLPVAKALLKAGARNTKVSHLFVKEAIENFEFHRAELNKDKVEEESNAARELCELFQVEPPKVRQMHDGESAIVAVGNTWQKKFESLWEAHVPSNGSALTVQGEVIRIAGKLRHQLVEECGEDWDKDYRAILLAWFKHLGSENALDTAQLSEAKKIVELGRDADEDAEIIPKLSVAWVELNPTPIKLGKTSYQR